MNLENKTPQQLFKYYVETRNIEKVKEYINHPEVDLTKDCTELFNTACRFSKVEIVKLLLEDGRISPLGAVRSSAVFSIKEPIIDILLTDNRVVAHLSKKDDIPNRVVLDNYLKCILADVEAIPVHPISLFFNQMGKSKFSELTPEEQTLFKLKFC